MRELRLVGVHDDGEHLLLAEEDDRFTLPIDDALRDALRRVRPTADVGTVVVPEELRPRDVQALLRAGMTVEEVAERADWTTEKVLRYEGPIRAEREHVASVARGLAVSGGPSVRTESTFGARVERRLDGRGVPADDIVWDSWRGKDGDWSVVCAFPAGGRQRQASWRFDIHARTLEATDDEARWLGEDETGAGPTTAARDASVYDVEAEGGLNAAPTPSVRRVRGGRTSATAVPAHPAGTQPTQPEPVERPVDLVAAMRERSKNRRRKASTTAPADFPEDATPRERLDTTGAPPPLGSHPPAAETGDSESSVDELGHDPVTGTADLFAGLPLDEATDEAADEAVTEPDEPDDEADEPAAEVTEPDDEVDEPAEVHPDEATVPDRPSTARKGRPSVPSWDDIMFGRRPGRE